MNSWTSTTEMNHSVAIEELLFFIERVANGAATMRFLCGDPGFGMSLLMRIARQRSLMKRLATLSVPMTVDWSEDIPSKARAKRVEDLLASLSTQESPDGEALDELFRHFAECCTADAAVFSDGLIEAIERRSREIAALPGGSALVASLSSYCLAFSKGDRHGMKAAIQSLMRMLNGKTAGKTAHAEFSRLLDLTLSELLFLLCALAKASGYAGLVVFGESNTAHRASVPEASNLGTLVEGIAQAIRDGASELGVVLPMPAQSMTTALEGLGNKDKPWTLATCQSAGDDLQMELARMVISVPSLTVEDFARVS